MSGNLLALLYLVAGALFIMALSGLSHPATSRRGNHLRHGRHGDRHLTTLAAAPPASFSTWLLIMVGLAHRRRHRRGDRPAHRHDGHAAARRRLPFAGRPRRGFRRGRRPLCARMPSASARPAASMRGSLVEMSLGAAIGAVTFTGSIVAFTKLRGCVSGAPVVFRGQHSSISRSASCSCFSSSPSSPRREPCLFWLIVAPRLRARRPDHHPDRRRRHAGRHLDAQFLFRAGRRQASASRSATPRSSSPARWSAHPAPSSPTSCARG